MTTRRCGYTIIELLSVLTIIGILSAIAIPSYQGSVARADAASIQGDWVAVRQAAYVFLEDNARFPQTGRLGTVPAEMAGDVPAFEYKGMTYYWLSADFRRSSTAFYGGRALGVFVIFFNGRTEVAEAFRNRPAGWAGAGLRDYYWTPAYALWVMVE